ncbi:MAG TPA: amidase [Anaerolineae bacterium]|nr:amidase [Anaerolineae bacterium]
MINLAQQFRDEVINITQYVRALQDSFDAEEPTIFSFVPEARRWLRVTAALMLLCDRWPDKTQRPPLFGVPIGVKDIFHVNGLPTRAGSSLPPDVLAGAELQAVTRLKAAGAFVLGKTVTTEFAWFGPGPARNPHNPLHTPGGSSSGSGAAVGAGIVPIALGSQTIGSINRPSSFRGCVGFKPSYDRISKEGAIELSRSHDHVGVLAESVSSAELAIATMIGTDAWQPVHGKGRPAVLGIPVGAYLEQVEAVGMARFWEAVVHLEDKGYIVKRIPALDNIAQLDKQHRRLLAADAASYHAQFSDYHGLYHEKTRELIAQGQTVTKAEIMADKQAKSDLATHLTALMDANGIDLWLTPSAPGPAPLGHASTGNPIMQLPFTMAGFPMLNIPFGMVDGLPVGVQFSGRFGHDEGVFDFGRRLEIALNN